MTVLGILACAASGLFVGVGVNVLVDNVPRRRRLLPLGGLRRRCDEDPPPRISSHDDPDEATGIDLDGSDEAAESTDGAQEETSKVLPQDGAKVEVEEWHTDHGAPALTWPLVRNRCSVCQRRASWRYPAVELAAAGLFGAAAARFGTDWALPAYLVFFTCLLAVSVIDLEHQIIPNRIVYPTIFLSLPLLALAAAATDDWGRFGDALLGAFLAWGGLLIVFLIAPGGMGFGDVRLAFVLGLFLGWIQLRLVLTGIFMGFLLGSVIGLTLVALRIRGRKDHIPFGPFLAAGAALTVLFSTAVNRWSLIG